MWITHLHPLYFKNSKMTNNELINLGDHYVSDFVPADFDYSNLKKYPLNLLYSEELDCPVLGCQPPKEMMWGKYWYRSSVNPMMVTALKDIVDSIQSCIKFQEGDVWLDIAANDGTMLSFVDSKFTKVGIDPVEGEIHESCKRNANHVCQDYFTRSSYENIGLGKKAKVVTCIAMFYDLQNPHEFINDVVNVMDDEGVFVLQLSYTPLMIKQLAFDNIVSEHYAYHSLSSVEKIAESQGLKVIDVELNDVNGGSIRVYLRKNSANEENWSTKQWRDVSSIRYESLKHWENEFYNPIEDWKAFSERLEDLKTRLYDFVKSEKEAGKSIWAYGASTKGNTLLQYFNLDHTLIDGVAERSEFKYGLRTIGTHIPIHSEKEMRDAKPDYLIILPWHFVKEFGERESEYLNNGGKFIVPCPELVMFTKDGYTQI